MQTRHINRDFETYKIKNMKKRFKKGDILICLKYGRNNSDMIEGEEYTVSEVDADGMIKLQGHPDWWSTERFKLKRSTTGKVRAV